jgi:HEAT repeat protein
MILRAQNQSTIALGLIATFAALLAGCADGPIPEMRHLNPWVREQWAKDEVRGPTYHKKAADLAELRARARSMPPAEALEVTVQLSARLKEEKSPVMRAEFVRTLGELPPSAAQEALVASMSDDSPHVRVAACKALARRPSEAGFQSLAHAIAEDSDLDVRIGAAHELGKFRDYDPSKALRPALDERDPALQLAAMQSLEAVAGHTDYRRSVVTWREYLDGGSPTPPPAPSVAELARQYLSWF